MSRRRNSWPWWVLGASLLLIVGTLLPVQADGEKALAMPEGFDAVELGMSQSSLEELRPKAKALDIFGEREQSQGGVELLVEELADDSRFDSVNYTFVDQRLCAIRWQALPAQGYEGIRKAVLAETLARWGGGFTRQVFEAAPGVVLPVLRWSAGSGESAGSAVALLTYTPSGAGSADEPLPKLLQVMLFTKTCLPPDAQELLGQLRAGSPEESARLYADLPVQPTGR